MGVHPPRPLLQFIPFKLENIINLMLNVETGLYHDYAYSVLARNL